LNWYRGNCFDFDLAMARLKRFFYPGHPLHVLLRGNNGIACFREHEDYAAYLDKLRHASSNYGVAVHAYVLMEDHVHLLMTPQDAEAIGRMMQSLGCFYTRYFNVKYLRTGTLWEGRYKSTLMENDQYPLLLMRYVESNPVRTGYVCNLSEYPFSSYRYHAEGEPSKLIQPHQSYLNLARDESERRLRYQLLSEKPLDQEITKFLQKATTKGWVLGSRRFKHKLSNEIGCKVEPQPRGGDRKSERYKSSLH
jgi:putative transposase